MAESYNHSSGNPNPLDGNLFIPHEAACVCDFCVFFYLQLSHLIGSSANPSPIVHELSSCSTSQWDHSYLFPNFNGPEFPAAKGGNATEFQNMNLSTHPIPIHAGYDAFETSSSSSHEQANPQPSDMSYPQTESQATYYQSPVLQHTQEDPQRVFKCGWTNCGRGIANMELLMEHIQTIHIKPQYQAILEHHAVELQCGWEGCSAPIAKKESLDRHVRHLHVDPRSFHCPFCLTACNRRDNLTAHLRATHKISTWWRRCTGECYKR